MYTRNLLKPADYVSFIPAGIQMTLQYNESGNLERVFTSSGKDRKPCDTVVMTTLLNSHIVPGVIPIKKGTSWVYGVLYTGQLFAADGMLPDCIYPSAMSTFVSNPTQFNFFAYTVESTAINFVGAAPTRQCLSNYKFKTLPGWIVPANFTDATADNWLNNDQYPFNDKLTTSLAVFRKGEFHAYSLGTYQRVISRVQKYTDENGYIKASVSCIGSPSVINLDYPDVVTYNLHANTVCVFDATHQLIHSFASDTKKQDARSHTLTCSYCGKTITVPASGEMMCPNNHCTSMLAPNLMHFCSCLGISTLDMNTATFAGLVSAKKITCLTDIFTLPEFENLKDLPVTLATILRAIVPVAVIPSNDIFTVLANRCSNNERTFRYYLNNSGQISSDLGITHKYLPALESWLSDMCNLSDVFAVLDLPCLSIQCIDKKFDGAPIFRGKKLYITGDFVHGELSEIIAILQSYSAEVTTQFDDSVHGVVVGSKQENIDGHAIRSAKNLGISVMDEVQFFNTYEIDKDLQENLVYNGN